MSITEISPIKLAYSQDVLLETLGIVKNEVVEIVNITDIVRVISKDPSLSARLLAIANSPIFFSGKVNSLEQAVLVLGIDIIRSIAMWLLFYETSSQMPLYILNRLREHATKVALATVIVGETAKDKDFNRCVYFLAGLMHDIGRMFIGDEQYIKNLGSFLVMRGDDLLDLENEICGLNHVAQGEKILTKLNLPAEIISALTYHHNYGEYHGKYHDLASSVYIAENILSLISRMPGDDGEWEINCDKIMAQKGLNEKVVLEIERRIKNGVLFT